MGTPLSRRRARVVLVIEDGVVHGAGAYLGERAPLVVDADDSVGLAAAQKVEGLGGLPVPTSTPPEGLPKLSA